MKVGVSGNGTLNVAAGGEVTNHHGYLGYSPGSTGEATVTGSGSGWNHSGVLSVGRYGSGTLNITDGGEVTNSSNSFDGFIGRFSGSTGEATVTGVGSQWNNSDDLWIGGNDSETGGAGTLNLYDSGLVTVTNTTKRGVREHLTLMAAV